MMIDALGLVHTEVFLRSLESGIGNSETGEVAAVRTESPTSHHCAVAEREPKCIMISQSSLLAAGVSALLRQAFPAARLLIRRSLCNVLSGIDAINASLILVDGDVLHQRDAPPLQTLRVEMPGVHIGVIARLEQGGRSIDWIENGADSILVHDAGDDHFLRAVSSMAEGRSWIDPSLQPHLLRRLAKKSTPSPALTARELEVLRLVARGCSNKLIGRELGLAEGTVKTYLRRLRQRLHARDRTQAVVEALRLGLVAMDASAAA